MPLSVIFDSAYDGAMDLAAIVSILKDRRKKLKLNQKEVGQRVGLSQSQISNVERGSRTTPWTNVLAYAESVEMRVDVEVLDLNAESDLSDLVQELRALSPERKKLALRYVRLIAGFTLTDMARKSAEAEVLEDEYSRRGSLQHAQ